MVGVRLYKVCELVRRTTFCEGAGGVEVRYDNRFARAKNLRRFAHEVHATHHDDISIRGRRLLRKGKTVAHEVGDFLNVGFRIIMRHDDSVFLAAQAAYLCLHVNSGRERGVDTTHFFPVVCHSVLRC